MTRYSNFLILFFIPLMLGLGGCSIIGDIFKAGFYTALFLIVAVVALIGFVIYKMRR